MMWFSAHASTDADVFEEPFYESRESRHLKTRYSKTLRASKGKGKRFEFDDYDAGYGGGTTGRGADTKGDHFKDNVAAQQQEQERMHDPNAAIPLQAPTYVPLTSRLDLSTLVSGGGSPATLRRNLDDVASFNVSMPRQLGTNERTVRSILMKAWKSDKFFSANLQGGSTSLGNGACGVAYRIDVSVNGNVETPMVFKFGVNAQSETDLNIEFKRSQHLGQTMNSLERNIPDSAMAGIQFVERIFIPDVNQESGMAPVLVSPFHGEPIHLAAEKLPEDIKLHVLADWAFQLLKGMAAMESCSFHHRDIKPRNIVVKQIPGQPDKVTIIDHGNSNFFTTHHYEAPEFFKILIDMFEQGNESYAVWENELDQGKMDIWAAGFVLLGLLADHPCDTDSLVIPMGAKGFINTWNYQNPIETKDEALERLPAWKREFWCQRQQFFQLNCRKAHKQPLYKFFASLISDMTIWSVGDRPTAKELLVRHFLGKSASSDVRARFISKLSESDKGHHWYTRLMK